VPARGVGLLGGGALLHEGAVGALDFDRHRAHGVVVGGHHGEQVAHLARVLVQADGPEGGRLHKVAQQQVIHTQVLGPGRVGVGRLHGWVLGLALGIHHGLLKALALGQLGSSGRAAGPLRGRAHHRAPAGLPKHELAAEHPAQTLGDEVVFNLRHWDKKRDKGEKMPGWRAGTLAR